MSNRTIIDRLAALSEEENSRLQPAMRELTEFSSVVIQEINEIPKQLLSDTPFARRTKVRTIFACAEALAFHMKGVALEWAVIGGPSPFTQIEEMALKEITFEVHENAVVKAQKAKIRTKANVQLAFDALHRVFGVGKPVQYKDGWSAFCQSLKVRDRLMHPKSAKDFDVSNEEMVQLEEGWKWFAASLNGVTQLPASAFVQVSERRFSGGPKST